MLKLPLFDSGIQGLVLNKLGRKLWGFVEQLWGNVEISKLSVMKLKICEMRATAISHKNENGECGQQSFRNRKWDDGNVRCRLRRKLLEGTVR